MSGGNVSTVERVVRMKAIQRLTNEGLTPNQIAEELGMGVQTVQRNIKYLEELSVSDLTPEDRAKKRAEIELEYKEIAEAAKEMFDFWREEKPSVARSFLTSWKDAFVEIAKIYGLESIKVDSLNQFNINQYEVPDKIDAKSGAILAEAIKKQHYEKRKQETND